MSLVNETSKTPIERILREIPLVIRRIVKSLADDTRLAIVMTLWKNKRDMSFSELCHALGLQPNVLSPHLKNLVRESLVENYYEKKADTEVYSFYSATPLSQAFMNELLGVTSQREIQVKDFVRDYLADLVAHKFKFTYPHTDIKTPILRDLLDPARERIAARYELEINSKLNV